MDARTGDDIVVDMMHTGEPARRGTIQEVLGAGDTLHYRVRWSDGHESVFYPGSTAHVVHPLDA